MEKNLASSLLLHPLPRRAVSPAPLLGDTALPVAQGAPQEKATGTRQSILRAPFWDLDTSCHVPLHMEQSRAGCTGIGTCYHQHCLFLKENRIKGKAWDVQIHVFVFCFLFLDENRNTRSADFQESLFLSDFQLVFEEPREICSNDVESTARSLSRQALPICMWSSRSCAQR